MRVGRSHSARQWPKGTGIRAGVVLRKKRFTSANLPRIFKRESLKRPGPSNLERPGMRSIITMTSRHKQTTPRPIAAYCPAGFSAGFAAGFLGSIDIFGFQNSGSALIHSSGG